MRAAKSHLIRTGRFPSFAELKAELCKATAATGGSDHNHAAALLRVRNVAMLYAARFSRIRNALDATTIQCSNVSNRLVDASVPALDHGVTSVGSDEVVHPTASQPGPTVFHPAAAAPGDEATLP